jgi:dienelactone hydrolase
LTCQSYLCYLSRAAYSPVQNEVRISVREECVEYRDGDTDLRGLLVYDAHGATRPGLLVVHGGAGLDDHAKGRARKLARLGLVTLACDMYGQGVIGDRDRMITTIRGLLGDRNKLCQRILAGVNVLASDPRVNGNIAAVGYCFGGRTVLEFARSGADLCGAISVHGSLETANPARPGEVRAKILVCHGAVDPHVPTSQVTGFIEEMNAAQTDYQLVVYGGAMHGFTHDTGRDTPGVAYHAASDARSLTAIRTFLSEVFGSAES